MKLRIPLLLALAAHGFAQDAAPLKLTLREAVQLALKQNPRVILANLGVAQSEQDRNIARSALLPQVVGHANETVNRLNLESAIGFSFPGFPQHVGPYRYEQFGANFNAPVLDLTLWRRYRARQSGIDSSRAQETTVREESVQLVVSQYLGSQRAAADVEAAQSRVDLAQAIYDQAADLQKNGVGTGIDTLRSNVQLQNEKQRLIVARTQLADGPLRSRQTAECRSQTTRRTGRRGELLRYSGSQRRSGSGARLGDSSGAAPDPCRRTARRTGTAGRVGCPAAAGVGQRLLGAAGAQLQHRHPRLHLPGQRGRAALHRWPHTGGARPRGNRDPPVEAAGAGCAQPHRRSTCKTSVAQLASARSEVDVARMGIDLARQEVEQARDRFQAGVANSVEVVQAQDGLARASDNQIAALYRYNQARADLAHSIGQMEALYAK